MQEEERKLCSVYAISTLRTAFPEQVSHKSRNTCITLPRSRTVSLGVEILHEQQFSHELLASYLLAIIASGSKLA
jgi:hypothetical protein